MEYPDIIVITGTSRGLGKELALNFLDKGIKVIGISRTESKIEHKNFKEIIQDISYYYETEETLYEIFEKLQNDKKVGIILSAAILGESGGLIDANLLDWEEVFSTNVLGNLAVLKGVLPHMLKNKFGRIVILAGGGAAYAYPLFSAYSLSKVALVREVENLAKELDGKGDFSTVALAPGAMETEMLKKVKEKGGEVRTTVDISQPIEFIDKFMYLVSHSNQLNGKFVHSKDEYKEYLSGNLQDDVWKEFRWFLRRIE